QNEGCAGPDVFSRQSQFYKRRHHGLEQARPGQLGNHCNQSRRFSAERFRDAKEALNLNSQLKNTRGNKLACVFCVQARNSRLRFGWIRSECELRPKEASSVAKMENSIHLVERFRFRCYFSNRTSGPELGINPDQGSAR